MKLHSPLVGEDMQPINSKGGVLEVVRSSLHDIALQIASIVVHHHAWSCMPAQDNSNV